jgi:drug/metabolite transporter (DMT)-like permease
MVSSSRILRVVLWMTGTLLSFSVLALSIRGLAGSLSIFEILTVRTCGALVILLTLAAVKPELRPSMAPRRMGLNLIRNSVHYASQYVWALSLTLLPLATVFALEFTMPIWLAIIAVLFLGEKMTSSRVAVVVLGFIGALVILRPGFAAFQPASMLVLTAAVGYAIFNALTKKLTATEKTFGIVFWMNAMQLPMGLAGSDPLFFQKLGWAQLPSVIGIGIAGLSAHYCLTNAFRAGDATLVMPIDFLRVPLIALVGWWFFGEALDPFVFLGGAIMLTGIVWNLRAEAKKAHRLPDSTAVDPVH